MSRGFYRLHRGWLEHPVFANESFCQRAAFVWLVDHAQWQDERRNIVGKEVLLLRGQLSFGIRYLAAAWRWDEKRVRRFLTKLQASEIIAADTAAGQIIITICKYDLYQASPDTTAAPIAAAPPQHRRGAAANTKKVRRKRKEEDVPKTSSSGQPAAPAPVETAVAVPVHEVLSARDIVWKMGPGMIAFLTGKSDRMSRAILGKLLSITGDDCTGVFGILQHAQSLHPLASAEAHLIACARARAPGRREERERERPGSVAWMADIPGFSRPPEPPAQPYDFDLKAEQVG
jgi:hypothetical protein